MSEQVEVVYFMGCPNAAIVIETLQANRIPFETVIQDLLPKDSPKRSLSSPSVLVNGVQVIGSATSGGCSSCTVFNLSAQAITASVRSALLTSK